MTEEQRWLKVQEIVETALDKKLSEYGLKKKAKLEISNGKLTGITEQQMQVWKEAYPAVDIQSELRGMAAWIVSNPTLAPKSQVGRFANTWLSRSQNRASIRSIPTDPRRAPPNLCEWCLKTSTGSVNGRRHCDLHSRDAMDGPPPKFMPGVLAKPVSGS